MISSSFRLFMLGWFILLAVSGCQSNAAEQEIVYIGWDEAGKKQIFLTNQSASLPRQLTDSTQDVVNFAITVDGKQIAYATQHHDGSELWLLGLNSLSLRRSGSRSNPKLILTCPDAICSQPVWATDGWRLVYEKRLLLNENGDRSSPSLYWLDTKTGESNSVEEVPDSPSYGAQFSPDGNWISYVSPADEGVVAYNFDNGRKLTIPSLIGSPAAWNSASSQLIVADLNNTIAINLFVTDLDTETRTLLTIATGVDDGTAVISPTGEWVAFGRKLNRTATGRQIWLIRPDGSDAHALTDELLVNFGRLRWSENGRYLLYQRFDSQQFDNPPTIHIIDINSGEIINISPAGFHPSWIPSP